MTSGCFPPLRSVLIVVIVVMAAGANRQDGAIVSDFTNLATLSIYSQHHINVLQPG